MRNAGKSQGSIKVLKQKQSQANAQTKQMSPKSTTIKLWEASRTLGVVWASHPSREEDHFPGLSVTFLYHSHSFHFPLRHRGEVLETRN